ncbi:MAG TPA: translation initiation factor IF-2 [Thermoanaerobaculia bacterium]
MAAAKIRVSDIAKRMGKSEKDVIFQLQSLGAEITDASQVLEPEVIQALITGKKLTTRARSVIMREDKPQPEKAKKEAVRPPRPIVKPTPRTKVEAPKEEAPVAPAPPPVIIPEFIQAAEDEERAAKEAPPAAPAPPSVAPPMARAAEGSIAPPTPKPAAPRAAESRRPAGPTGPRARAPQGSRPNYAGQTPAVRPMTTRPGSDRPPMAARPATGARPTASRPAGPGAGMRSSAGPGLRPTSAGRAMPMPPPVLPGGATIRRKKPSDEVGEEGREKKKPAGKGVKKTREVEVDAELFTKGPFSGTQIIAEDIGPDIVLPEPTEEEIEKPKTPSARRDTRKQAAPVSAKVLEFKKPTGKVALTEGVTVKELADRLGVKANDLMKHLLMKKGLMVSINQPLGADLALEIAKDLDIDAEVVSFETAVELQAFEKSGAKGTTPRGPVITVMGHVDHGKTSLLDAIRETNVAAGEAGGITQHIGAYHVEKRGRKIVFLDTPGHEAFTMMRARGAKVTDIVVLVVAADDGVMPQTKEAIDHARAAKVPIIVAINKIDKPNANVDRVRRDLATNGVQVEQYGGDVVSVEVSATKKQGIDDLLDMILLTADLLDLKATPEQAAKGVVLEARKEVGRGIVATALVQDGTLKIGDPFFSGTTYGRVRAMTDERGQRIKEAGPATPVQVTGFDDVPNAGDPLQVLDDETQTRIIGQMRQEKAREAAQSGSSRMSLDQLFQRMQQGIVKELNVILKGDVQGSVEVLNDTLRKLSTDQVKVNVIHSSVGAISTNDVLLASASEAIVVGFNVRPERNAAELAEKEGIDIRLYTVIYNLVDEIKAAMTGLLEPKFEEKFQGRAEVRETFKVPKAGVIAGCMVVDGVIPRTASVRLLRDNRVIYEGKIGSLRHFKNDVSEVRQGFECGIGIEKFQDIKIGDVIEAFKVEKLEPAMA